MLTSIDVLETMRKLLVVRRRHAVSRQLFIRSWARLRRLLERTPEYVSFRRAVIERAGGACELCARVGKHVHHKKPMAFHLDLALDPDNGMYLCVGCHAKEDKESRREAKGNPKVTRSPAAKAGSENARRSHRGMPAVGEVGGELRRRGRRG